MRMADMKMRKARRNRDENAHVMDTNDQIYGDFLPEFYKSDKMRNNTSLHPELRKSLYSNKMEIDDPRFSIQDKEDELFYETYNQMAINYFEAKKQHLDDCFENQFELTSIEYMEMAEQYKIEDANMKENMDFMYNYLDFDNNRVQVRKKYLLEMNKKTNLRDIGETLDELILDSKAKNI